MRMKETHNLTAAALGTEYQNDTELSSALCPSLTSKHDFELEPSDVLVQLQNNLLKLEDLHGRLHFMVREVRQLIVKK